MANLLAMQHKILICALCTFWTASALQSKSSQWQVQRDDLTEYNLDLIVSATSSIECASLANERHQAVSFSRAAATCRMLSCRLGWSGCSKCRNARNSSLPLLMVRRLDDLGATCWRTFQHRVDGSVDFYRNWTDYVTGFGDDENRNWWMGLEAIHSLTRTGDRRVRWEMSSWNDSWWWWENEMFAVRGADDGYRVSVGAQVTNRSNVMQCPVAGQFMNNQMFTTKDKDQDSSGSNCAVSYNGAWWYNACLCFNPNGRYFYPPTALNLGGLEAVGITFYTTIPAVSFPLNNLYSMKTFECLVIDFIEDV